VACVRLSGAVRNFRSGTPRNRFLTPSAVTGWVSQIAMDFADSSVLAVPMAVVAFPLLVAFIVVMSHFPVSFTGPA
jgi:hypothetical protein